MVRFALRVVLLAVVFYVLTVKDIIPGLRVDPNPNGPLGTYGTYLWIALIFGVVYAVVRPILKLFALPFLVLTLGLFMLVIYAALLGLTAALTDRLSVDGFGTAVIGGLVLAIASMVIDLVLRPLER